MYITITQSQLIHRLNNEIAFCGLLPMDVVVLKNVRGAILDHYVIFLGYDKNNNNFPVFIANYPSVNGSKTVQLVQWEDLLYYGGRMVLQRIRSFQGNDYDWQMAYQRAMKCLNRKSYNLIFNNCEHFANYVQYGQSFSQQTRIASGSAIALGAMALTSENPKIKKIGSFAMGAGLAALAIEFLGRETF